MITQEDLLLSNEFRFKRFLKFPYNIAKKIFGRFGFDIIRIGKKNDSFSLRSRLIEFSDISLIIDVGANKGQYIQSIRSKGYIGPVISFEPGNLSFLQLEKNSKLDSGWKVFNNAIGSRNESSKMHIAKHSMMSSLLPLNANAQLHFLEETVDEQTIEVKTLDSFLNDQILNSTRNMWLKIDTEGYELEVLMGAEKLLDKVKVIDVEVCFKEHRIGQPLIWDIYDYCVKKGFKLFHIGSFYYDYKGNGGASIGDMLLVRE